MRDRVASPKTTTGSMMLGASESSTFDPHLGGRTETVKPNNLIKHGTTFPPHTTRKTMVPELFCHRRIHNWQSKTQSPSKIEPMDLLNRVRSLINAQTLPRCRAARRERIDPPRRSSAPPASPPAADQRRPTSGRLPKACCSALLG